jgi:endonuclease YncB( thermonuclease family)
VAARLAKVVDGDTIDVLIAGQAETVRYIGVDTPERGQPGHQAATDANAALLGAGDLYLVADVSDRDRYGRLLRYVYTPDGVMVNQMLVAQDWAQPVEYPPDTRHAADLRAAAVEAAQAGLGFWSGVASDGALPFALAAGNVNLRAGPGTGFAASATLPDNTPLTVFGRTADGEWLQVRAPDRSGGWVAASVVVLAVAVGEIALAQEIPEPAAAVQPTTPPLGSRAAPIALPTAESLVAAQATLQGIVLFIVENRSTFELLQIDNRGQQAVDISGWALYGSKGDERCVLPGGTVLQPGEGFQVATGDSQPQARGMKCNNTSIWNNDGETIYLEAPDGRRIEIQSRKV